MRRVSPRPSAARCTLGIAPMVIACILCAAGLTGPVQAATVFLEPGPSFDGPDGFEAISTNGALVEAVNFSTTHDVIVVDAGGSSIAFVPSDDFTPNTAISHGSPGSTDPGWNAVIDEGDEQVSLYRTLVLSGLEVGVGYQVQLFSADPRVCCAHHEVEIFDSIASGPGGLEIGNRLQAFRKDSYTSIIGTFRADAVTQEIVISGTVGGPHLLNAYVLRALPEPPDVIIQFGGVPDGDYAGHVESGFSVQSEPGEWTLVAGCVRSPCVQPGAFAPFHPLVVTGGPTGLFRFGGASADGEAALYGVSGYLEGVQQFSYGTQLPGSVSGIPPQPGDTAIDELRIAADFTRIDDIRLIPVAPEEPGPSVPAMGPWSRLLLGALLPACAVVSARRVRCARAFVT